VSEDRPSEVAPRPLTGGAVRSAAAQVVVAVTGALTTLVVARILGPTGAGSYAVALSLVLGLTAFGTLGLDSGISYFVSSRAWAPRDAFVRTQLTALVLGVLTALIGLGLRLTLESAFRGLDVALVVVVVAGMPFALSWFYGSFLALAMDRYEDFALPPALQSLAALLLVLPLAAIFGLEGALVGLLASNLIAAVITFIRVRRDIPAVESGSRGTGFAQLAAAVRFGLKTYLANVLGFVQYRLDLFILNATAAAADVGQYAVAVSITSAVLLLPRALSGVLLPRVASLSALDAKDHREMVETNSLRHVGLIVIVSIPLLAAVLVLLVKGFFGEPFDPAIGFGLILLPGSALMGIAGVLSATIVGRGRPLYSLYNSLITTPLAVGLYIALVPPLEGEGAALASSISYTAVFALTVFFYTRVTGRSPLPLLVPTRAELADYARLLRLLRKRLPTGRGGRQVNEP
jgi:O-antigen/teichoic acid export membrane protein